jgi:hypothetical protein
MRKVMISGEFNIENVQNSENVQNAQKYVMPKRAQERLDALKAAGIDTSNLFAVGEQMVVRMKDGVPTQVMDDDPIYQGLFNGPTVPDHKLFRRWILAQTFRMLRHDYTKELKWKGYEYQWRMLEEELRVQAILYKKDPENFEKRNRFFNMGVFASMYSQYLLDLNRYISSLKTKKCKGVPYKTIYGRNVFVADIKAKVILPIRLAYNKVRFAKTPNGLYLAVKALNKVRVPMHNGTPQIKTWVNAYKAAGAYYSMENLIRFHGMRVHYLDTVLDEKGSLAYLNEVSKSQEGYWLLGMLKNELKLNNISIDKKMKEWENAKLCK